MKKLYEGVCKQIRKLFYLSKPYLSWILASLRGVKPLKAHEIPIIINNRNRYSCLKRLIAALESRGYRNIYVIDNASTYPPLLEYYEKEYSYRLIRLEKNVGHLSLWRTGLIDRFRSNYFVYTDPDVLPIEDCPSDFLDCFLAYLKRHPFVEKVGFALKIDDLPDEYDKKSQVIAWESQFWRRKSLEGNIAFYKAAIDTTFALYRPMYIEGGFLSSPHVRVGYPYEARHLPWYNDSSCLDEEERYYLNHCETPSHWSKGDVLRGL